MSPTVPLLHLVGRRCVARDEILPRHCTENAGRKAGLVRGDYLRRGGRGAEVATRRDSEGMARPENALRLLARPIISNRLFRAGSGRQP
jgi:hypothetical protein